MDQVSGLSDKKVRRPFETFYLSLSLILNHIQSSHTSVNFSKSLESSVLSYVPSNGGGLKWEQKRESLLK